MECLGCNLIDIAPVVLRDGRTVCNKCRAWMLECEARQVLSMPLAKRQMHLVLVERARGKAGADRLKNEIMIQHGARK